MNGKRAALSLAGATALGSMLAAGLWIHSQEMPTGCPTLDNTGSKGGGVGLKCDCTTQMTLADTYEVQQSGGFGAQYTCMPTGYDSTFHPVDCAAVVTKVGNYSHETSTQYYTFCATDCNHHNVRIAPAVTCEGITTTYYGFSYFLECNHDSQGHVCPGT
jgi:hypothetical protein